MTAESLKKNVNNIIRILDLLKEAYPDAGCALKHRNVFELIVCVILSAQTTDVSVNKVTRGGSEADMEAGLTVRPAGKGLFDVYPDAESLARADQEDVMEIIRTIGMYKTKSSNIIRMAEILCEKHAGQVPEDYDALVKLPGVGRKTANVVLSVGFGHQRIAVDTHVYRVSHRIGLAGMDESPSGGKGSKGSKGVGASPEHDGTAESAGSSKSAKRDRSSGSAKSVAESAGSSKSARHAKSSESAKCDGSSESAKRDGSSVSAKSAGAAQVLETEHELMDVIPEERWSEAHHSLIWHGRSCCTARNPKCGSCPVRQLCANPAS